jgi:hypothetical protein
MKKNSTFPRLSQARIHKLLNRYNEFQTETNAFESELRSVPLEKLQEKLPFPSRWSLFYELDYPQHLAYVFYWNGIFDEYCEAINSDDPITEILSFLDSMEDDVDSIEGYPKNGVSESEAILSWIALSKTLKSYMTFGKTLSTLNSEIGRGSFPSLYKALQIDPTIITTPQAAHLFSIGLLKKDKKRYISTLYNKMSSNLKRYNTKLEPIKFILTALTEVGDLKGYSQSERYNLFVKELSIYTSSSKNKDTRDDYDSLNRLINRWLNKVEIYGVRNQDMS